MKTASERASPRERPLTEAERDEHAAFIGGPCQWCGLIHPGYCPRIAEILYYPNGTRRSVRFHPPPVPEKPKKAAEDA